MTRMILKNRCWDFISTILILFAILIYCETIYEIYSEVHLPLERKFSLKEE